MNWTTHPTHRTTTRHQRQQWANQILKRDNHVCQIQGPNCTHTATEADHKHSVTEGGNELNPDNGQAACHNCHQTKTQQEATRGKNNWKRKPEPHPALK